MHRYAIIFWNEATDTEKSGYTEATNYWDAEEYLKTLKLEGYVTGVPFFVEPKDYHYYTVKIEDLVNVTQAA